MDNVQGDKIEAAGISPSEGVNKGCLRCSLPAIGRFICAFAFPILILFAGGCKKQSAPPAAPEVQVVTVVPANVPIFEEWIGTLDGFVNAQIHAEVTGYLLTQNYAEGSEVKKGDLLFQIDPRPFEAALHQAQAKLAQDKAQAGKTELDLKRDTQLVNERVVSREVFDDATQANLVAEALVKQDEAAVETTQLNLGFTKITSPVDGLAGMAKAQIGDLVGQSSTVLTTVSTLNPIKVYFQVSEQSYLDFWRHQVAVSGGETNAELQLIFANGWIYPEKGKFLFADRQVNSTTGTLQIVGLFPNANFILRPGQYAGVRVQTQTKENALLVPQRAVTELQGGYQVVVVDAANSVDLRSVKVGAQIGSDWIITSGVKSGDRVVVEGLQDVKAGTAVDPKPFTEKADSPPAK